MTFDLEVLRTLAVAKDLGTFRQAAARLGRTPSAVSLQMKRLERDAGAKLFRKSGRTVELTEYGEIVLRYGREMLALNDELLDRIRGASLSGVVRVGFSQDFAETVLPSILSQFVRLYPNVQVEVLIEPNAALVDAVERSDLNIALVTGEEARATAEVIGQIELGWIAGSGFELKPKHPVPLLLLGRQCAFRKRAIEVLERANMPWRVAAVSPSVTGLWATTKGLLGVAARSRLGMPAELVFERRLFGLPELGKFPVTLHLGKGMKDQILDRLYATIRDGVLDLLSKMKERKGEAIKRRTHSPGGTA